MLSEKAKRITDEAEKRGRWLYDPGYKKWYANDEFLNALQIVTNSLSISR